MIRENLKKIIILAKNSRRNISLDSRANVAISSEFEGMNYIGVGSSFAGFLGYASYIAHGTFFSGKIGRFTSVGSGVRTVNGFHPLDAHVSTHPAFYSGGNCTGLSLSVDQSVIERRYAVPDRGYDVLVGSDVWICDNSLIIAGVTIGDGAVVAAGSVVTKDVPPYAIVGGNPAKVIRYRFSEGVIEWLLSRQWWNDEYDCLKENAAFFFDVDKLMQQDG